MGNKNNRVRRAAEWCDPRKLRPWARNPKADDEVAVEEVCKSITLYGFGSPLVARIENNEIIAGHTRHRAALRLGMKKVPVRFLDIGEEDAHRLALADNRTNRLAEWDTGATDALLAELGNDIPGFDGSVGVDFEPVAPDEPLRDLNGGDDAPAPTASDALRSKWATETGQLWKLGDSRLLCGDSTDGECVARVFDGIKSKALLMNTDAPYGVAYATVKAGIPGGFTKANEDGDIANDTLDGPALQAFLETAIRAALPHLRSDAAFYFWHPMLTQGTFFAAAAAADIIFHRQIVWVKPGFVLTRSGQYHWQHELCFYGWRRGHEPPWLGDMSQTSVWSVGRDDDAGMHPTQKPIELFVRPIANHTRPGDVVFEPFSGSGSQLLAAHRTGRRCLAIDKDPRYVAVALERMSRIGVTPELVQ